MAAEKVRCGAVVDDDDDEEVAPQLQDRIWSPYHVLQEILEGYWAEPNKCPARSTMGRMDPHRAPHYERRAPERDRERSHDDDRIVSYRIVLRHALLTYLFIRYLFGFW